MSLSLLQKGTGGALCVYASPMPDATSAPSMPAPALAALGPMPCVVGVNARGAETPAEILAFAKAGTGRDLWWAALIGYSLGCQRIRQLWFAGAPALALVLADGMAGQKSPTPEQLSYAQSIVRLARAGVIVTCILHTYIEPGSSVISTAAMTRLATGWALNAPPRYQTVRRGEQPTNPGPGWHGGLSVYSMGSGPGDEQAHRDIASVILPLAIREEVRTLVDLAERPEVTTSALPASSPEPPPVVVKWTEPGASAPKPSTLTPAAGGVPATSAVAPATPAAPASPASPPQVATGTRVLLLGDSLAIGLRPRLAQLAKAAGLPFVGAGVQSTTIRHWLAGSEVADAIALADPTHTLVCLGTNDMLLEDPGAEGRRAAELLANLIRNQTAVAWIGPPRLTYDKPPFRAALAQACAAKRVRVFDSQALDLERARDGIHMTPAGYAAWAESIAAWHPFVGLGLETVPREPAPTKGNPLPGARLPPAAPRSPNQGRTPVDATATLGERAARFSLDEQADGVHEDPPRSNRSPRIDQYRRGMGSPGDPWCAWGFCYAAYAVLRPGETLPHAYTGSVAEIVRTGRFHKRRDGYAPRLGDGAVWDRDSQDPTHGGKGHIGRVMVVPDVSGRFESIEGNSGDAWAQRAHQVDEPSFVGWVEYPGPAPRGRVDLRDPLVLDGQGELPLDAYVARVVTAEMGGSREIEALKAQAIVARTFVERALRDDPTLGTAAKPVPNSPKSFQAAAAEATPLATRAANETRGGVALYRGRLILAMYVNGAPWAPTAWKGVATAKYPLERHVTYNAGLTGRSVQPTYRADPRRPDNRGDMSQNGADALAARGWKWPQILRYFYGEDLDFTVPEPADPGARPRRPKPSTTSSGSDNGPLLLALGVAALRLLG